jgi:hypothetical protein
MIKMMLSSILMLLLGLFSISCGIIKGRVWAEEYINPLLIGSLEEREGIINAFVYIPIIFGVLFILLGLIIFTVVFIHWTKKYL